MTPDKEISTAPRRKVKRAISHSQVDMRTNPLSDSARLSLTSVFVLGKETLRALKQISR